MAIDFFTTTKHTKCTDDNESRIVNPLVCAVNAHTNNRRNICKTLQP